MSAGQEASVSLRTRETDIVIRRVTNGWVVAPSAPFSEFPGFPTLYNARVFTNHESLADYVESWATTQGAAAEKK